MGYVLECESNHPTQNDTAEGLCYRGDSKTEITFAHYGLLDDWMRAALFFLNHLTAQQPAKCIGC